MRIKLSYLHEAYTIKWYLPLKIYIFEYVFVSYLDLIEKQEKVQKKEMKF
jgi:hypothetical protein